MNWQHLRAFVWLRWRLLVNQCRKSGNLIAVLMILAAVCAVLAAVPLFVGAAAFGYYAFDKGPTVRLLYVWDGLVLVFLFFWSLGLLAELQRTESLTVSKFLHLPVSVSGVFLINYVSSLVNLTCVLFVPVLFGLALGLVLARGAGLLMALPLTAAFLLMVSAVTYQFQGWLASLMSNPRRRRTVIVTVTMLFVLIFQVPNLINMFRVSGASGRADGGVQLAAEIDALNRSLTAGEIDVHEHRRRVDEVLQKHNAATVNASRESLQRVEQIARTANLALPIGWLPQGIMTAAEGQFAAPLLACAGMTLIGTASLWRAYRTTIGLYQGQFTTGARRPASRPAATPLPAGRSSRVPLLERTLPGLSEPVSAVALATLRSLLRAPESKMVLLGPLVMGAVFISAMVRNPGQVPALFRPLAGYGAMVIALFGMLQLMANQFGMDRDGFRVFVLSAASRRDILLGKNLACAPLAFGFALALLTAAQFLCPLQFSHLLSMLPQYVAMYLLFCLLTNFVSIYTPMAIPAGTLKPANPKLLTVLVQMAVFMFLFPLTLAPTLLPLGAEAALAALGWNTPVPVCLLLTLVECVAVVAVYRWLLRWQGDALQRREQRILEIVTGRAT